MFSSVLSLPGLDIDSGKFYKSKKMALRSLLSGRPEAFTLSNFIGLYMSHKIYVQNFFCFLIPSKLKNRDLIVSRGLEILRAKNLPLSDLDFIFKDHLGVFYRTIIESGLEKEVLEIVLKNVLNLYFCDRLKWSSDLKKFVHKTELLENLIFELDKSVDFAYCFTQTENANQEFAKVDTYDDSPPKESLLKIQEVYKMYSSKVFSLDSYREKYTHMPSEKSILMCHTPENID